MHKKIVLILLALHLGCASYQKDVGEARSSLQSGHAEDAVKKLEPLALKDGDDQLVYLLDYAMALQAAERYDDSIKAFATASKIAEVKDYHSLSRVAGSLLLNEGMVQYKGEDYEKLLINVFLAQNYLMKNNLEDALVETRRLDEILIKYRNEAKRDYEQNAFAIYLSALIWESNKQYDDAYIAFNQVYKLRPNIPMLKSDLIRMAAASRRMDEFQKWKKQFPEVENDTKWKSQNYGELVLIYQQGRAPVKRPHPDFQRIPKLYAVPTSTQIARLDVEGVGSYDSQVIYSIQDVAIKTLDDAYAGLVAKRVGGMVTKAVVADQVRQKSEILGVLTWVGLNLADQADLRQWSTLPETFQIAKVELPIGIYKVHATGLASSATPSGESMPEKTVTITSRKKTFLLWRSYN